MSTLHSQHSQRRLFLSMSYLLLLVACVKLRGKAALWVLSAIALVICAFTSMKLAASLLHFWVWMVSGGVSG